VGRRAAAHESLQLALGRERRCLRIASEADAELASALSVLADRPPPRARS
jgi:hypothetical protein